MSALGAEVQCSICGGSMRVEPEPERAGILGRRQLAKLCASCDAVVCLADGASNRKCQACGGADTAWLLSLDYVGEDPASADCASCGVALEGVVLATDRLTMRSLQFGRQCRDCGALFCLNEEKSLGVKLGDWTWATCPNCGTLGSLTGALVAGGTKVKGEAGVSGALARDVPPKAGSMGWLRALARAEMEAQNGEAVPLLLETLEENESPAIRATAAVYLGSITWEDSVVPGLTRALLDGESFGRDQVPELGGPGLAAQLISGGFSVLERTKTMYVHQIAEKALEVLEAYPDTDVLVSELESTDTDRRRIAARQLGWLGDPGDLRVNEALAEAQHDSLRVISKAAAKALKRLNWRKKEDERHEAPTSGIQEP